MIDAGDYRRLFDLSGRTAIVTGATGLLGRRFCAGLADHGATVAVVDLEDAACKMLAAELSERFGVKSLGVAADITLPDEVQKMVETVEMDLGAIDILHNNAATKGATIDRFFDPVESFRLEVWRQIMAVNLDAAFLVAREVGTRMANRGRGSIIQTCSIYGVVGPDQRIYEGSEYLGRPINTPAIYSASKAGLDGLTRYLATYWGAAGIRVNSLTPGGVLSGQNATFEARYAARTPLNRMAQAEEMVGALVFLAADASSYITGQNLIVDGGLTAW